MQFLLSPRVQFYLSLDTYARRLAGLGAKVAVADLSLRSYEEFEAEARDMSGDSTVAEIQASGGTALGIEFDVTDHAAVNAMVASPKSQVQSAVRVAGRSV